MALAGLGLILAGCGVKTTAFHSVEGRFSLQTPVELTESVQPVPSEIGEIPLHLFFGKGQTHGFAVSYADSPFNQEKLDPVAMLNIARDSSVANLQGKVTSETNITVDGHPGRDITATGLDSGQDVDVRLRIVLAGHRAYEFVVTALKGKMNQAVMNVFLNSVKIAPPPPAGPGGKLAPANGNFTITTPVPLMATSRRMNVATGPYTVSFFNGGETGPTYMVLYYDSPYITQHDPTSTLNLLAQETVAGVGGKLQGQRAIKLGPYPGMELVYGFEKFGRHLTAKSRLYLAGNRVYQTQTATPGDAPSPDTDAYLDSFAITAATNLPVSTTPPVAPAERPPVLFKSAACSFSIMTPVPLNETSRAVNTNGSSLLMHQFAGDAGNRAYFVTELDSAVDAEKDNPAQRLRSGRDGILQNLGGKLDAERSIALDGHPGTEISVSAQKSGVAMVCKVRMYIVGHRVYQIMTISQTGDENPLAAEAFLDSFKLLPDAPAK